ncbi:hypothetical protein BH20ACT9_BH20ACT9_05350 [soil metagenome]
MPSRLPARYWGFFGVVFLGVSAEWSVAYWGADFLRAATGLGRSHAAAALGVFFAAMLAGRLLGSRLAARLSGPGLLVSALGVAGFPVCWLAAAPLCVGAVVDTLGTEAAYGLVMPMLLAALLLTALTARGG